METNSISKANVTFYSFVM